MSLGLARENELAAQLSGRQAGWEWCERSRLDGLIPSRTSERYPCAVRGAMVVPATAFLAVVGGCGTIVAARGVVSAAAPALAVARGLSSSWWGREILCGAATARGVVRRVRPESISRGLGVTTPISPTALPLRETTNDLFCFFTAGGAGMGVCVSQTGGSEVRSANNFDRQPNLQLQLLGHHNLIKIGSAKL
eukprot:COSAG01_NODE_24013_length_793_cov_4.681556_2_plen_192_part_01